MMAVSVLAQTKSLWIHGAAMSGMTWDNLRAYLPNSSAPNLPGRADQPAATTPCVEDYAEACLPYLQEPSVVIGHSLGGMVALELAARYPERIKALILIEAIATVQDKPFIRLVPLLLGPLLSVIGPRTFLRFAGLGQPVEVARELMRHEPVLRSDTLRDDLTAAAVYDGRRHLSSVRCPTCLIYASENHSMRAGADLMVSRIANVDHQIIPGGHILHTENEAGVRHTIDKFLETRLSNEALNP